MDYVSLLLLTCLFLLLLLLQWRFPLRRQHFCALRRLVRNFLLSVSGFAVVRLGNAADSTGTLCLGATSPRWAAELADAHRLDGGDRNVFADGLRLLVVAPGQSSGPVPLALSQRASHRSRPGREHCRPIPFRRDGLLGGIFLSLAVVSFGVRSWTF
jgi:hypothetical protein